MQNKEPERGVAALRPAESDTVLREKTQPDEELMFWIGISPPGNAKVGTLSFRIISVRHLFGHKNPPKFVPVGHRDKPRGVFTGSETRQTCYNPVQAGTKDSSIALEMASSASMSGFKDVLMVYVSV